MCATISSLQINSRRLQSRWHRRAARLGRNSDAHGDLSPWAHSCLNVTVSQGLQQSQPTTNVERFGLFIWILFRVLYHLAPEMTLVLALDFFRKTKKKKRKVTQKSVNTCFALESAIILLIQAEALTLGSWFSSK